MTSLITPTDAPAVHGPPQGKWTYTDWEGLPDDGQRYEIIDGALYIEVLSPDNTAYDEQVKLDAYALAGVPEYAIVSPRERTLSHYRLSSVRKGYTAPTLIAEGASVVFGCLPTINVPIGNLFAGAPDTTL